MMERTVCVCVVFRRGNVFHLRFGESGVAHVLAFHNMMLRLRGRVVSAYYTSVMVYCNVC